MQRCARSATAVVLNCADSTETHVTSVRKPPMPSTAHIYKFAPRTKEETTNGQDESPVIRLWSPSPLTHPALQECTQETVLHVHLWLVSGEAQAPTEQAPWNASALQATMVLRFSGTTTQHLQTAIDLMLALQCDGIHSVLWNAELPDMAALFDPENPWPSTKSHGAHIGSAMAHGPEHIQAALDAVWSQLSAHTVQSMLVLRAHAPGSFSHHTKALTTWRAQHPSHLRWLCWDVYDPDLKPGECRVEAIGV